MDTAPSRHRHADVNPGGLKSMRINPLTLRFSGDCAHLEPLFQKDYLESSLSYVRIVLVLSAFLYATFGFLDDILILEHRALARTIRMAVVCPLILVPVPFSFFQWGQRLIQPMLAGIIAVAGGGMVVLIVLAPPPASYSYYAGPIMVFIFGYTCARTQFLWASLGGALVILFYNIAAIGVQSAPISMLVNNNAFLICSDLIGMMACYSIERYARRDFFLVQLLEKEREKVHRANRELERRVAARTAELERANSELAVEVQERKKTEAERLRLADQLKRAEKMEAVGSMAAGVAHDLNNVLSALVSFPELILMDIPADSPLRKPMLTIKRSGEKAAAIVQDLLTLARRGVANKAIVNPNRLIEDYLASPEFLTLQKYHPHVKIRTELDADLFNVMASPIHLSKAVMNLVSNAAEALLVDGDVVVQTANCSVGRQIDGYELIPPGDYVLIRVTDTGVGIAPEDLKQVFEPFFTKKHMGRSGTGLGMSVVWATVKDLDGFIDIETAEGRGTTFKLYLPVNRQGLESHQSRVSIEDYRGSERVLIVDDLPDQLEIASGMLGKLGYRVVGAASGEEAVTYLSENAADILVLDMVMDPGIDGCETYRRIIEMHPDQRAIIASGFSETDRVRELQRLGAGEYIKKPYTLEKIGLAVRRELDRPAVRNR
jgi:signal transduction histidine kinase/ActR/RegA family two-component response regulator